MNLTANLLPWKLEGDTECNKKFHKKGRTLKNSELIEMEAQIK